MFWGGYKMTEPNLTCCLDLGVSVYKNDYFS